MRVHATHNKTFPGHEAFILIQPRRSGNMFPVRRKRTTPVAPAYPRRSPKTPQTPRQHPVVPSRAVRPRSPDVAVLTSLCGPRSAVLAVLTSLCHLPVPPPGHSPPGSPAGTVASKPTNRPPGHFQPRGPATYSAARPVSGRSLSVPPRTPRRCSAEYDHAHSPCNRAASPTA
jgi:hypothetical protein